MILRNSKSSFHSYALHYERGGKNDLLLDPMCVLSPFPINLFSFFFFLKEVRIKSLTLFHLLVIMGIFSCIHKP